MKRQKLKKIGRLVLAVSVVGLCVSFESASNGGEQTTPNLARDYEVIINYCRLLMDHYPDTRQVENALAILSQVADEYLGEYRITHEGRTYSSYDSNK